MGVVMMKAFVLLAFVCMLFAFGCLGAKPQSPPAPGSDMDEHGCIPSAGYSWCESSQKCIRSWEENCAAGAGPQIFGNGTDAHGCKSSAGYTWCAAKQKCLRIWEEKCEAALSDGLLPNIIDASACPGMGGRVVDVAGDALCPEGESPLAEVRSETGTRKACCMASAVRGNGTNKT
jgi:hypothetical protein